MFDAESIVLVAIITAMAAFIQRVTGFGFGIFVMMFFPHIMQTHTSATAVSTLVSCIVSVYNAIVYRKSVPYRKIVPLIIAALVTIPIGVHLSVIVTGDIFKKALGIVLVALSIYFLFFNDKMRIKASVKNGLIAGGTGGILTGLFSTGGPPIVLYLMNALSDNLMYFASAQFYFGLTGIYSTAVRFFSGIVNTEVIVYSLVGFGASMIGNFAGKRVFDKLNAKKLRQLVYLCMIVSGIVMVV